MPPSPPGSVCGETVEVPVAAPALSPGDAVLRIDPRYFRPAEMVAEDLKTARRHALLRDHGMELPVSHE